MTKGIKRFAALAAFVLPLAALTAIPASAVHDSGAFELDGNAVTNNSTSGVPDDWDRVCHSVLGTDCSTTNNANTSTVAFASQGAATGTTFTGGGSKDPIDSSSWAWNQASGGLPGKDVLLNAFAARYDTCPLYTPSTCSVIYFGMDRFDNSGDAQNGFWFFQNPISLGTSKSGGGQSFTGVHKNGDVLVVSDFSAGGTTSTISVYEWNSACTAAGKPFSFCADSNLQLLQSSTAANCATAAPGDAFCGIVNPNPNTTAPWSFTDKKGNTSFDTGELYEGGVNLAAFPGLAGECFASTLAESRSSASTSAVLKSFILQNFGACGSKTETHPFFNGNDISGQSISLDGGSIQVTDQATVTVTGVSTYDGSVTFHLCGPADFVSQDTCIAGGALIGSAKAISPPSPVVVTSDLAPITAVGRYCWRGNYSGDAAHGVKPSFDDSSTECFTVFDTTAVTTAQNWLPNDSATITSAGGTALSGSVTFTLYNNGTCDGTNPANVLYTEPSQSITGATPQSAITHNTSVKVSASGTTTVSWLVVYTSNDTNVHGSTSNCETTTLTITN